MSLFKRGKKSRTKADRPYVMVADGGRVELTREEELLMERALQEQIATHPAPPQRPIIPSVTTATRRVDMSDVEVSIQEEILAVAEDFANYVAARGRGISVATPARRRLREEIERVVLGFVRTAEPPAALDKRAEARVLEIVRQAIASGEVRMSGPDLSRLSSEQQADLEAMMVREQSEAGEKVMPQDPPPPPPDRGLSL